MWNAVLGSVGAIVGAGFASGREIMSFFSRYGAASWIGVVSAAATMGLMAYWMMGVASVLDASSLRTICQKRMGRAAFVGTAAFFLLLSVTAGSMLSAAGELVALVWPLHFGYETGFVLTLALGVFLIRRNIKALYIAARVLLPLMVLAFVLCLTLPAQGHMPLGGAESLPHALSYGAMNIALCAPVLCEVGRMSGQMERKRTAVLTALVLLLLLSLGNALLLSHPELVDEALPMVQLLRNFGLFGFYLSALVLYLAVFTTFISCLRGVCVMLMETLSRRASLALCALTAAGVALFGFTNLVGVIYPILGYLCIFVMLSVVIRR